jgi:hypothetical protein
MYARAATGVCRCRVNFDNERTNCFYPAIHGLMDNSRQAWGIMVMATMIVKALASEI